MEISSLSPGSSAEGTKRLEDALPVVERLFPFFCLVDEHMTIEACGKSLWKIVGDDPVGKSFSEIFTGESLIGPLTSENLRGTAGQLFVARRNGGRLRLRGQVIADEVSPRLLIAWSPWISSTDAFKAEGLSLSDFGVQDSTLDVLHLLQANERAQEEAAEPLERIQRFFSVAPDLMFMLSHEGEIRQVNHACVRVLGVESEELIGTDIGDWLVRSSGAGWESVLAEIVGGRDVRGEDFSAETRMLGKRLLRLFATMDSKSGLIFATAQDVTKAEEGLRLTQRILDSAPNAMLVVDDDGRITYANAATTQVFQYLPEELVGLNVDELIPERLREKHLKYRKGMSLESQDQLQRIMGIDRDVVALAKDGQEAAVRVMLTSLGIKGQPRMLASVQDVRAQLALESELTAARDAAVNLAQAKSDLLANTSHEIRTPLASIIGITELLLDTALNDDQQRLLHTAQASGEHLLSLVNDILTFAKAESEASTIDQVTFSPVDLVDESVRTVTPTARERNLTLVVQVGPSTPDFVTGDREKLRTVLLNLLGNAIKFTQEGEVRVSVAFSTDEVLCLEVKDTGIGFKAEQVDSLFEPFAQADASTTRRFGGSGLGLAISKQAVEILGGSIEASAVPGEGAVFRVLVPMAMAQTPTSVADEHAGRGASDDLALDGLEVLLVEDDDVNAHLISRMLSKIGAVVANASDGQEALNALQQRSYDVVLMDCHMPRLDGFEATRRIRDREPTGAHQVIIALTASALQEDRDRCIASGMDDYMFKPVRLADLEARLLPYARGTGESENS